MSSNRVDLVRPSSHCQYSAIKGSWWVAVHRQTAFGNPRTGTSRWKARRVGGRSHAADDDDIGIFGSLSQPPDNHRRSIDTAPDA